MNQHDSRTYLRESYFCSGLDDQEFDAVASIATIRTSARGEMLFQEGEAADGFYILLQGRIRIYKAAPDGREYTLHLIRPGQMFAEVAVFHDNRYPANAQAREESLVAFFPKHAFLSLIENSPQICIKIIASLSRFIREFNRMVEDLSLREVSARLAVFLLHESERIGSATIRLSGTKGELANQLGTVGETLSRNLKKMKELGLVAVGRREITILDPDGLLDIAEGGKL